MNIKYRNIVFPGFVIALVILIYTGYTSYSSTKKLISSTELRKNTQSKIKNLQDIYGELFEIESDVRGYIITGDENYITYYSTTFENIRTKHTKVLIFFDDPSQKEPIKAIDSLIELKLNGLNERIKTRKDKGFTEAQNLVKRGEGKEIMDNLKRLIAKIIELENAKMITYDTEAKDAAKFAVIIIPTGSLVALIVVLISIILANKDIAAKEKAEKEIHESEKLIHDIMDNSPAVVFLKDIQGKYLFVNKKFENLFGLKYESVLGRKTSDLVPKDYAEKLTEIDRKVINSGDSIEVEEIIPHEKGDLTFLSVKFPIFDSNNKIKALCGISTDITNRKIAEEELDTFFNVSLDLLCFAGFDGYFRKINPMWEKTLGYTKEELFSKPFLDFVHPDDKEATISATSKLAEGKDIIHFENRYRTKNGSYKWILWNSKSIVKHQTIYAVARDITRDKLSEESMLNLNFKLEESNKDLESFSYTVSHDLRAPLRHIIGFAEKLNRIEKVQEDEEIKRIINKISTSASDMGVLIDELLMFSGIGRTTLVKNKINLNETIKDVISELEDEIKDRDIEWTIDEFPFIFADGILLKLVIQNLISNSIKYTSKCKNSKIQIKYSSQNKDETIFTIKDNGVGFDDKYSGKLFGVFQRLHRAEEFEGTGIGLAIVQRIINKHGGKVWAEGLPEKGASFYFSIPNLKKE